MAPLNIYPCNVSSITPYVAKQWSHSRYQYLCRVIFRKNIMPHDFMQTVYSAIAKAVNVCCSIIVVSK